MAAPPPVLTVAVEKGPRQGETRQCRAGAALRVGRVVKGNDLAVRDGGASQQHLVIEFLPPPAAGWAVSDLGTSNGTLLNGAPLAPSVPAPLSHGDLIKVGDSTVLAISMASDSDPNPVANPSQRRTSRHAAAAVEEKPPVVTRRGTRNKAPKAAEAPEMERVEPDAETVVVEEKPPAVSRRGTRNKVPTGSEAPKVEKEEPDAAAVVVEEKPQVARRRGGRKKLAPGEMDETAEVPPQEEQKKASEPTEPENDDEEKAPVVTRRGGRKKSVATVAPPPLPPKTRSVRGRSTRATSRTTVLQEEHGVNELTSSRTQTENRRSPTAVKGGQDQKGIKVAAGDGGVELEDAAKALNEEMRKGKSSDHRATSDNGANAAAAEPTGEREDEEAAEAMPHRRRKKVVEFHESQKDEEETTVVTRRGGRKKVTEQSEPEKDEETTMATRHRGRNKVVEQPETKKDLEETIVVTHRGGQKKVTEQSEADKEDDEKEEGVSVLTHGGGRKEVAEHSEPGKDEVTTVVTRRGQRKNVTVQPQTNRDVEQTTVVTRRGGRKKVAEQSEPEKDEETTVATRHRGRKKVVEQPETKKDLEETIVVTHRGGQKKVMEQPEPDKEHDEKEEGASVLTCGGGQKEVAEHSEPGKDEVTTVVTRRGQRKNVTEQPQTNKDVEGTTVVTRRGGRKKAVDQLKPEKDVEVTTVVTRRGRQKKVEEQPQPDKEDDEEVGGPALTRHGGRKKAMKPPEPEKEEEDAVGVTHGKGQKKTAVVTCHARRKKDPAEVVPPPLPPKTGPGRVRRRVTRTSARNNVLEEDAKVEQEEDELTVPREQSGNLQIEMTMNGGDDRELKVDVRALEDHAPEGRDSAQHASGNGGKEDQGGAHCSSRVDSGSSGIPNTTSKYREDTKLKAYSTPFDVRLDRALKKYSA